MSPAMFREMDEIMNREAWVWQQDGSKPHTANTHDKWLQDNVPHLIGPDQWLSNSSRFEPYALLNLGILLHKLQSSAHRHISMKKHK